VDKENIANSSFPHKLLRRNRAVKTDNYVTQSLHSDVCLV